VINKKSDQEIVRNIISLYRANMPSEENLISIVFPDLGKIYSMML
jgi:hypothetical protein